MAWPTEALVPDEMLEDKAISLAKGRTGFISRSVGRRPAWNTTELERHTDISHDNLFLTDADKRGFDAVRLLLLVREPQIYSTTKPRGALYRATV